MTKGVVLFASNNGKLNYVKQAAFLARRIKKYMNLPTTIITDVNIQEKHPYWKKHFDKIVYYKQLQIHRQNKRYFDGDLYNKHLLFNNSNRQSLYRMSPYDETIVMDTDYVKSNDKLLQCFNSPHDFLIYKNSTHIGMHEYVPEFEHISDVGIDFYWATVFFFRKTPEMKIFFDLVRHIEENYVHYRSVYHFRSPIFRNDFAFSIAIHIMNGYQPGNFAKALPGKKYYATDRDICLQIDDSNIKFLTQKKQHLGEYTGVNLNDTNVHIMNKFSLERVIDVINK